MRSFICLVPYWNWLDNHFRVVHDIIWQAKWLVTNAFAKLRKALCLNLVLHETARKYKALSMKIGFDKQNRSPDAIQRHWLCISSKRTEPFPSILKRGITCTRQCRIPKSDEAYPISHPYICRETTGNAAAARI